VLAYTGDKMRLGGWDLPVVIDLRGLSRGASLIANLDHEPGKRVGHVTQYVNNSLDLRLAGVLSAATPFRDEVVASYDSGFVWQASIEANPTKVTKIRAGENISANGRSFKGPLYLVDKGVLKGFAFVSHGADDATSVSIAARGKLTGIIPPISESPVSAREPASPSLPRLQNVEGLYWDLVAIAADDHCERPSDATVYRILFGAGRSVDEFARDVKLKRGFQEIGKPLAVR
jgi:hypothetical protein